jgi:anti-sigma regulatory factor (Ser/Thr protein kinase)
VGIVWVRHAPTSAAVVRHSVLAALSSYNPSPDEAFDASLIASELVGNAVRHAPPLPSGHLAVEWFIDENAYLIAVTDGGDDTDLTIQRPAGWETSGRGLAIVAALADDWGAEHRNGTTRVWARRALAGAPNRHAALAGGGGAPTTRTADLHLDSGR